jgi:hypothetical protein
MVAGKYIHDRPQSETTNPLKCQAPRRWFRARREFLSTREPGRGLNAGHLFLLTGSKRKGFAQKPERDGSAFMLRSETRHAPRSIL